MGNGRSRQRSNGRGETANGTNAGTTGDGPIAQTTLAVGDGRLKGLRVPRLFTTPGVHPYDEIEWERRKASLVSRTGKVSFEQDDVEFPSSWSVNATNIVT